MLVIATDMQKARPFMVGLFALVLPVERDAYYSFGIPNFSIKS